MEEIDESQWTDMMFTHPHVPGEIMCHLIAYKTQGSFFRDCVGKVRMVRSATIHEVKQKEVESSWINDYLRSS